MKQGTSIELMGCRREQNKQMDDLLEKTIQIIITAGDIAKNFPLNSRKLKEKEPGQFYTDADIEVERKISVELLKQFPDYGIESEERVQKNLGADYVWFLDPIDGTNYYAKDVPFYSVSLALRHQGKFVLGIAYFPDLNRLYYASLGEGAFLDNRNTSNIECSKETALEKVSVCLEIVNRKSSTVEQQRSMEKIALLIEKTYRVRIIGVGSLGLCLCASGGFDAYVNLGSMWKNHDIAAGQVIVSEAGGEFLQIGGEGGQIIAGRKVLCGKIRDVLKI